MPRLGPFGGWWAARFCAAFFRVCVGRTRGGSGRIGGSGGSEPTWIYNWVGTEQNRKEEFDCT